MPRASWVKLRIHPGNQTMSLEIGGIVGDYQVVGLVGHGGMGRVFKVRNLISDRIEAMKVLLPDAAQSSDLTDRFIREIKVVAALEHPNIAALRTALRVDNQLLMVMEYVQGQSLDARLRAGRMELWQGVDTISQVLAALAYAHQQGVIHRDIKPSNILIGAQGHVKLTDFGIASKLGDPRLTATGMALGSLYYMSPEQVRASAVDSRSDVYSIGVTLYETVTGRRPIDGDSFYAVMQGHLEHRPPPPISLCSDIPEELSHLIEKALEKAPEARFQSAEEFREALAAVRPAAGEGLPSASQRLSATNVGVLQLDETAPVSTPLPALPRLTPVPGYPAAAPAPSPSTLHAAPAGVTPTPAPRLPNNTPPRGWNTSDLEQARKELAAYIGPMARVLVSRAAKSARSLKELYQILAQEIPSPADRQKFLTSRPL
jgi:serine/threonine protein kinase